MNHWHATSWRRVVVLAVLTLAGVASCSNVAGGPAPTPTEVRAKPAQGGLPRTEPNAVSWSRAPEHVARLLLQDQTEPKLDKRSVEELRVRALLGDSWLAVRMQWADDTQDDKENASSYSDAVAVQYPMLAGGDVPDGAMGQKGRPVRIHVWKAAWQAQLDSGVDNVTRLYPHAGNVGTYPSAAAPASVRPEMSARYSPAVHAGNLMALGRADAPVQDLVAEGFGTLMPAEKQVAVGRGVYDKGHWTVTIARPLDVEATAALRPGTQTYVAFAVWNGSAQNVGARKMRTGWIPLQLEAAP